MMIEAIYRSGLADGLFAFSPVASVDEMSGNGDVTDLRFSQAIEPRGHV